MRLNNRFLSNNHLLVNDYFDANKRYVYFTLEPNTSKTDYDLMIYKYSMIRCQVNSIAFPHIYPPWVRHKLLAGIQIEIKLIYVDETRLHFQLISLFTWATSAPKRISFCSFVLAGMRRNCFIEKSCRLLLVITILSLYLFAINILFRTVLIVILELQEI